DEMPVETEVFDRMIISFQIATFQSVSKKIDCHAHTRDHVNSMGSSCYEIACSGETVCNREDPMGSELNPLAGLNVKEANPETECSQEAYDQSVARTDLSRDQGHYRRKATCQQDQGHSK